MAAQTSAKSWNFFTGRPPNAPVPGRAGKRFLNGWRAVGGAVGTRFGRHVPNFGAHCWMCWREREHFLEFSNAAGDI